LVEHSNQKRMAGAAAKLEPCSMHLDREDTRLDCPSPQPNTTTQIVVILGMQG